MARWMYRQRMAMCFTTTYWELYKYSRQLIKIMHLIWKYVALSDLEYIHAAIIIHINIRQNCQSYLSLTLFTTVMTGVNVTESLISYTNYKSRKWLSIIYSFQALHLGPWSPYSSR